MAVASRSPDLRLRFACFEADLRTGELRKSGVRIKLQDQPFKVLVALLERSGELVTRVELKERIWPDMEFGDFDHALNLAINKLRIALGETHDSPRFIETLPRYGYRFLAPVEVLRGSEPAAEAAASPAGTPDHHPNVRFAIAFSVIGCVLVVLLAWGYFQWVRPRTAGSHLSATRITSSTGLDAFSSFSPDGKSLAYSSDKSGKLEIYVRQLATDADMQLTADSNQNTEPAWSPDGQWVAYHSIVKDGIWIIPALGGTPRQLSDFGLRPAWSPDAERIAFQSTGPPVIAEGELGGRKESTIWIVSVRDGKLRQVTHPDDPHSESVYGHSAPAWSPNGRWIVFTAGSAIACAEPDGERVSTVLEAGPRGLIFDALFAIDGRHILYGSNSGELGAIWSIAVDADCHAVAKPEIRYSVGPNRARYLTRSPDGRQLAYTILKSTSDLYSLPMAPDRQEPASEPRALIEDMRFRKTIPAFSGDGGKIVFAAGERNGPPIQGKQVWIAAADGSGMRRVMPVSPVGDISWFDWLPGSESLLLLTINQNLPEFWRVDLATGRAERVGAGPKQAYFMRLAPDGRRVAYFRELAGTPYVEVLDYLRGEPLLTVAGAQMPIWSPDGKWLAIEVGRDQHIAVIRSTGGQITRVTSSAGPHWPHDWSPDGENIAFAGCRDGIWNLFSVSPRTHRETQLTHYTSPSIYVRYPAWSPRGTYIVYEFARTAGNIWTLELR